MLKEEKRKVRQTVADLNRRNSELEQLNEELRAELAKLQQRVAELEARLALNSSNVEHIPPEWYLRFYMCFVAGSPVGVNQSIFRLTSYQYPKPSNSMFKNFLFDKTHSLCWRILSQHNHFSFPKHPNHYEFSRYLHP